MKSLKRNESGIALVTAIMVLMLASGLMAGMFAALLASQRAHATDRDQSVAYAAAHAGLEKLTAGLAALFLTDFSPNRTQIAVVDSTPPVITGFTYNAPGNATPGSGYDITFTPIQAGDQPPPDPSIIGDPKPIANLDITTGPFEGFKGLITKYELTVTARSTTGNSEVRLRRELQTVAVPVFQFGIFGEKSLGFHAGPNFDFGGRVHTNESLFLAAGGNAPNSGSTLTFRDKITAVLQVVRDKLSNGRPITATDHQGFVSVPTVIGVPGTYRNLGYGESSGLITTPCISPATTNTNCWSGWKNLSTNDYGTNIRTAATGAKRLDLPLTSGGVGPIELIKRPATATENTTNALVFGQRYFSQASLRILLSDRAADIMNLPTVTQANQPLQLDAVGGPAGYVVAAGRPPVAQSPGNEPINAGNGNSLTRISGDPGGGPGNMNILVQSFVAGAWADGLPDWLKLPANATHAVDTIVVGGVNRVCTGDVRATSFRGCPAAGVGGIAAGTVVSRTIAPGHTVTTTISPAVAAGNTTYTVVSTVGFTAQSRTIYIGEDPVRCDGYNDAANELRSCTWVGSLDDDDPIYTGATTTATTPLLNGWIKIERQGPVGKWTDVTLELLNLGFAGPNEQGDLCDDPTPNAVIRLQRLRDNGLDGNLCGTGAAAPAVNDYSASLIPTDYYPNMLFDAREGWSRLLAVNAGMNMGGLFSYVALDANNLRRWIAGQIGATGNQVLNQNGYIIYFSDRRGNHDAGNGDVETGEYGHEDSINPEVSAWTPAMTGRGTLQTGENFNESGIEVPVDNPLTPETLQTYGENPHALAIPGVGGNPGAAVANMGFEATQRPWSSVAPGSATPLLYSARGRLARPVLFRRALKVINGGINVVGGVNVNSLPAAGINIVAENPVYIYGNFNATSGSANAEPNVPAAIIADSITLLSRTFRDTMTFVFPNDQNNRNATGTSYRFAMVTGKTIPFPKPAGWGVQELGSDGGVHNFMKMLEDWGGQTLNYRGSMVSLYYSRQAIGIYRADDNIYSPPTRGYNFDSDFLSPPLLPPGTPMFRDINTLKFRQILRPNQ